jgi:hypothetical protein
VCSPIKRHPSGVDTHVSNERKRVRSDWHAAQFGLVALVGGIGSRERGGAE